VVYLGGLGNNSDSQHLRSRHETAQILSEHGPPLTYVRAAMVVGAESESYKTLRYLVERLPVMVAPKWLETPTQPVAVDDAVAYLACAPDVPECEGREVQIGAAPRWSPTGRCSTGWRWRWTSARARSSRCPCCLPGSRPIGSAVQPTGLDAALRRALAEERD